MVRALNRLFNAGDFEGFAQLLAPDVELRELDPVLDTPAQVRGRSGVLDVMRSYRDALEGFHGEVHEYLPCGSYVVCPVTYSGTGRSSRAPTSIESVDRHLVHDGQIVEIVTGYPSKDEALASAL